MVTLVYSVTLGYPSALTWISQVRSCFIVAGLAPLATAMGFGESESSPGAYNFLWQLVGDAPSLRPAGKHATLSLALESGVFLAMHCHELLSV